MRKFIKDETLHQKIVKKFIYNNSKLILQFMKDNRDNEMILKKRLNLDVRDSYQWHVTNNKDMIKKLKVEIVEAEKIYESL